jgi:hypothetical protein
MRAFLAPALAAALPLACSTPPPELGRGPDLPPSVAALDVLEPGATSAVVVWARDLNAGPLARDVAAWFEPTIEEAARGGPAQWFQGLAGAEVVAIAVYGEGNDADVAWAVRGGEAEAAALSRRLAGAADLQNVGLVEESCGAAPLFAAGTRAAAAVGADLFVYGPRETVAAACRRAVDEDEPSLGRDPLIRELGERIFRMAPAGMGEILYFGRVPSLLRSRLQRYGLDPVVDRTVGLAVVVGEEKIFATLAVKFDDEAAAAGLVDPATEGIARAAERRSYQMLGLSPLIRALSPRSEGPFFFIGGEFPTPVVSAILARLRTIAEGTPEI